MSELRQKLILLLVFSLLPWRLAFLALPTNLLNHPVTIKPEFSLVVKDKPASEPPTVVAVNQNSPAKNTAQNCQLSSTSADANLLQGQSQINLNQPAACYSFVGLAVVNQAFSHLAVVPVKPNKVSVVVVLPAQQLAQFSLNQSTPANQQPAMAHQLQIDYNRRGLTVELNSQTTKTQPRSQVGETAYFLGFNRILRC